MRRAGFTLIELLVVIAVIGVLSTIVLIAINPLEQIRRSRDAARKSTQSQLRHALTSYYTSRNSQYPTADSSWITTLQSVGELQSIPALIDYSSTGVSACATNEQKGYCYNTNGTDAIVYVRLESNLEQSKCTGTNNPYFLWTSLQAQAGTVCRPNDPTNQYNGYTFIP